VFKWKWPPQHLYFSQEKLRENSKNEIYFQMNPPIRKEIDRRALMKSFREGEMDFLATDHAPHSREEKEKGISGLTGLDTFGPFVVWCMECEGVEPQIMARVCSENPGLFFNQYLDYLKKVHPILGKVKKGFGFIKKDYSASFTVLNRRNPFELKREHLKTKSQWSPFIGETFPGSVKALFLQGKKIF